MRKLFLSYARPDEQCARRLFTDFQDRGLDVWFDQESLLPGQDWKTEIDKAIAETDFVVLLLSNNSVERRGYFQKEVRLTLDVLQTVPFGHIYLLPVRLDNCKVPSTLSSLQYVDLFPDWKKGIEKLLNSIELQANIQLSARDVEKKGGPVGPSILLVNDEPASMNMVIDIWKSQGFKVDYAFDVSGAIDAIKKESPAVVVSDLSHFSFGRLITDRAGFEILEWAKANGVKLTVIITTSTVTDERRNEATKLGAAGICNTVPDLNSLISAITRKPIVLPEGVFSSSDDKTVRIISDLKDEAFVEQLTASLTIGGYQVIDDRQTIAAGARWMTRLSRADATLIILSIDSHAFSAFTDSFEYLWGEPRVKPRDVIPIVLFDLSGSRVEKLFRKVKYVDFSKDYQTGLEKLVDWLRVLPNKRARGAAPG